MAFENRRMLYKREDNVSGQEGFGKSRHGLSPNPQESGDNTAPQNRNDCSRFCLNHSVYRAYWNRRKPDDERSLVCFYWYFGSWHCPFGLRIQAQKDKQAD